MIEYTKSNLNLSSDVALPDFVADISSDLRGLYQTLCTLGDSPAQVENEQIKLISDVVGFMSTSVDDAHSMFKARYDAMISAQNYVTDLSDGGKSEIAEVSEYVENSKDEIYGAAKIVRTMANLEEGDVEMYEIALGKLRSAFAMLDRAQLSLACDAADSEEPIQAELNAKQDSAEGEEATQDEVPAA